MEILAVTELPKTLCKGRRRVAGDRSSRPRPTASGLRVPHRRTFFEITSAVALLSGVGLEPQGSIPHVLFFSYQGTFAIITAALISGAIVERMRFGPYLAFLFLWSIAVYAPIAHWVWGGGWLARLGALDFAGGTVVHVNAAAAALVAAIVLKPRKDFARQAILPHNVPFTLLGAGLLSFGWVG